MNRMCWALALLLLAPAGAAAVPPPDDTIERMQVITGRLYLNDHELKAIYQEMHGYASFTPQGPDRQLDYIQKLYLIIERARTHGYYLWRLLSIYDYLAASRRTDFLTLYETELRQARVDIRLSIRLIDLYAAFIEKEEIRKTLSRAQGILEANVYMYQELTDLIAPHLNKPPYPRRID